MLLLEDVIHRLNRCIRDRSHTRTQPPAFHAQFIRVLQLLHEVLQTLGDSVDENPHTDVLLSALFYVVGLFDHLMEFVSSSPSIKNPTHMKVCLRELSELLMVHTQLLVCCTAAATCRRVQVELASHAASKGLAANQCLTLVNFLNSHSPAGSYTLQRELELFRSRVLDTLVDRQTRMQWQRITAALNTHMPSGDIASALQAIHARISAVDVFESTVEYTEVCCTEADEQTRRMLQAGDFRCMPAFRCPLSDRTYDLVGACTPMRMRPCGCTVSAGAAAALASGNVCPNCKKAVKVRQCNPDKRMLHIIRSLAAVRVVDSGDIDCDEALKEASGEEDVFEGTWKGRTVTVKVVRSVDYSSLDQVEALVWMVVAAQLAGDICAAVTRLLAICWRTDQLWFVHEYCGDQLPRVIQKARRDARTPGVTTKRVASRRVGLPNTDVALLVLELASLSLSLHSQARFAHPSLRPRSVAVLDKQVHLVDMGITKDKRSAYFAPECGERGLKVSPATTVYGIAATAASAAAGLASVGSASGSSWDLASSKKQPVNVPAHLPQALRDLLTAMLQQDAKARPTLEQVHSRAFDIFRMLLKQDEPVYLLPRWPRIMLSSPAKSVSPGTSAYLSPRILASMQVLQAQDPVPLHKLPDWISISPLDATAVSAITALTFAHGSPDDAIARVLFQTRGLGELQFNRELGIAGARALACPLISSALASVTCLSLVSAQIDGDCMAALSPAMRQLNKLQHLQLASNQLGPRGAHVLAKALNTLVPLTCLDITCNGIGDAGVQALAPALHGLSQLKTVRIGQNGVSNIGKATVSASVQQVMDWDSTSDSVPWGSPVAVTPSHTPVFPEQSETDRPEAPDAKSGCTHLNGAQNVPPPAAAPDPQDDTHTSYEESGGVGYHDDVMDNDCLIPLPQQVAHLLSLPSTLEGFAPKGSAAEGKLAPIRRISPPSSAGSSGAADRRRRSASLHPDTSVGTGPLIGVPSFSAVAETSASPAGSVVDGRHPLEIVNIGSSQQQTLDQMFAAMESEMPKSNDTAAVEATISLTGVDYSLAPQAAAQQHAAIAPAHTPPDLDPRSNHSKRRPASHPSTKATPDLAPQTSHHLHLPPANQRVPEILPASPASSSSPASSARPELPRRGSVVLWVEAPRAPPGQRAEDDRALAGSPLHPLGGPPQQDGEAGWTDTPPMGYPVGGVVRPISPGRYAAAHLYGTRGLAPERGVVVQETKRDAAILDPRQRIPGALTSDRMHSAAADASMEEVFKTCAINGCVMAVPGTTVDLWQEVHRQVQLVQTQMKQELNAPQNRGLQALSHYNFHIPLLAATWGLVREAVVVPAQFPRSFKELLGAAVSKGNRAPFHCFWDSATGSQEVMRGIMVAWRKRADQVVSHCALRSKAMLLWFRNANRVELLQDAATVPFTDAEAAELVAASFVTQFLNRVTLARPIADETSPAMGLLLPIVSAVPGLQSAFFQAPSASNATMSPQAGRSADVRPPVHREVSHRFSWVLDSPHVASALGYLEFVMRCHIRGCFLPLDLCDTFTQWMNAYFSGLDYGRGAVADAARIAHSKFPKDSALAEALRVMLLVARSPSALPADWQTQLLSLKWSRQQVQAMPVFAAFHAAQLICSWQASAQRATAAQAQDANLWHLAASSVQEFF